MTDDDIEGWPRLTFGMGEMQLDEDSHERFIARLESDWPIARESRRSDAHRFRDELDRSHGEALRELPMLHTAAVETLNWAQDAVAQALDGTDDENDQFDHHDVLVGLGARALLVFDEVSWLLAGGYPGGAFARCRTLHELFVTSGLIARFGGSTGEHPSLVERYLVHREAFYPVLAKDISSSQILDPDYFTDDMLRRLDERTEAMRGRYGPHFSTMWGWAAPLVPDGKPPTLANLSPLVFDGLNIFYSLTSDHVHAGSAAWHAGLTRESDGYVRLAGPTDHGLTVPAQLAMALLMGVLECAVPTNIEVSATEHDDTGAHFLRALGDAVSRTHDAFSASEGFDPADPPKGSDPL